MCRHGGSGSIVSGHAVCQRPASCVVWSSAASPRSAVSLARWDAALGVGSSASCSAMCATCHERSAVVFAWSTTAFAVFLTLSTFALTTCLAYLHGSKQVNKNELSAETYRPVLTAILPTIRDERNRVYVGLGRGPYLHSTGVI